MKDLSFHHLVNQSLMEKHLEEAFSEKDFVSLRLPLSTFPCLSQGLPRNLDASSPYFLQLKSGFCDLQVLKKRILDKPLLHLYKEKSRASDHLILIITYVVPGGFGDFFAQRYLKKILKKQFPHIQITSLVFVEKSYCEKIKTQEDEILQPFTTQESLNPKYFDRAIHLLLQKAFLIYEIPTQFPFDKELRKLSRPSASYIQIGEYGYIQSTTYQPQSFTRCLGLHFLEYGLFIEDIQKTPLESLSQKDLACYLFSETLPANYLQSHDLYFSYLATDYGALFYMYLVIQLSLQSKRCIDLLCVDIGPFLKIIEQDINRLKTLPIKSLEIFYKNKRSILHLSDEGMRVRIIHTGHLNHSDFQILLQASKEPVGIRGNLSFSEALSLKKIFFYDPLSHNYPLYYELLSLAKVFGKEVFSWIQLFKPQQDPYKSAIIGANLLLQKDFKDAFEQLCSFILRNLRADEHMINIVYKALHEECKPHIKKKEQEFTALFLEEKISFSMLIQAMEKEINS